MVAEHKKVRFDPNNILFGSKPSPESVEVGMKVRCDDGAVADIKFKVEAPLKTVEADGTSKYEMRITNSQEFKEPEPFNLQPGVRRREDGLYWEIPKDFPEAATALLTHEVAAKEFLMSHFHEGNVFVDVGANVGAYSVRAAAWGMKVYAFEPNPGNLLLLKKNAEINRVTPNLMPFALGDGNRKARLAPNGATSRVVPNGGIEVDMRTLDSFELDRVDLLKIDVEGSELDVILGAMTTLQRLRPTIQIEMHHWAGAEKEAALLGALKGLGYKLEYLDRFPLGRHLSAIPSRPSTGP